MSFLNLSLESNRHAFNLACSALIQVISLKHDKIVRETEFKQSNYQQLNIFSYINKNIKCKLYIYFANYLIIFFIKLIKLKKSNTVFYIYSIIHI